MIVYSLHFLLQKIAFIAGNGNLKKISAYMKALRKTKRS